MSIETINPFNDNNLEEKKFVGWIRALSTPELTMKTSLLMLFNITGEVGTMEVEVEKENNIDISGAIGDGAGTGWADGTTKTALPISSALANIITNYTVLKIEDELVVVKSVDRNANTIEVYDRGYGSTTGVAHADTTLAYITGYNYVLGVKNIESRVIGQSTNRYYVAKNTVPSITFTKEDIGLIRKKYGEAGMLDYVNAQIDRMDRDLLVQMDRALIFHSGQKSTATTPGMSVGIIEEAQTNGIIVSNFGKLSTVKQLNDALTVCRDRGGIVNFALLSPANYDAFQELTDSNTQKQVPGLLGQVLGYSVAAINTKAGAIIPIMNLNFPDDKIIIGNSADLNWSPLTGFTVPGADRTIAQESTRNDQQFTVDSITQGVPYYGDTYRNMTILTGVTQV